MKKKSLPRLMLITNQARANAPLQEIVEKAATAGGCMVQLREKALSGKNLFELAKELRKITEPHDTPLLINERLDIALAAHADGLHLPETGLSIETTRKFMPNGLIGKSVHSLQGAWDAEIAGADYVLFGHIFPTASKPNDAKPRGLAELESLCQAVQIPVFAVGGITPERTKACLNAGAYGVAAIGALMQIEHLESTLQSFHQVLEL
ncbi:Thiamine-phosphate diphosphorylase [Chloroherpeton thalassium ATCC 35110]|uniref:Thiamine-phosphate synthase n=1 Tax=Chloroherpeton thalassium (strain ATCC 35110 / GB-78) TaxID=517418 RepID=B3QUZ4_CHLT3|nr:thiamine phosphate synthase [Chloroherpeton thalassium]ACF14495.1 Thiamine-phosphate diphosphorylase [Chloroherpeton thalassium ATCC 35110]